MVDLGQILIMLVLVVVTAQYYTYTGRKEGYQEGYTQGFFDSTALFAKNLGTEVSKAEIESAIAEEPVE
jgi:hypothetical protein